MSPPSVAPLACAYAWGALATWFVDPAWIGVGICSLSVIIGYVFFLSKRFDSRKRVEEAVDFLIEDSPAYTKIVQHCLTQANVWFSRSIKSMDDSILVASGNQEEKSPESSGAVAIAVKDISVSVTQLGPVEMADTELSDTSKSPDTVAKQFAALLAAIPPTAFSACCRCQTDDAAKPPCLPIEEPAKVSWQGEILSRQAAYVEGVRLLNQYQRVSEKESRYWAHVCLLLVQRATLKRTRQDTLMEQMLMSSGVSGNEIKVAKEFAADSPQRKILVERLRKYKAEVKRLRAEVERRKREEEEANTRREEALIERLQAEERQRKRDADVVAAAAAAAKAQAEMGAAAAAAKAKAEAEAAAAAAATKVQAEAVASKVQAEALFREKLQKAMAAFGARYDAEAKALMGKYNTYVLTRQKRTAEILAKVPSGGALSDLERAMQQQDAASTFDRYRIFEWRWDVGECFVT
jgi:hypothetical protein